MYDGSIMFKFIAIYFDCKSAVDKMDIPASFVYKSTHSSVAIQCAIHKINQRCKYTILHNSVDDLLIDPDLTNQVKWSGLSERERIHQRWLRTDWGTHSRQ